MDYRYFNFAIASRAGILVLLSAFATWSYLSSRWIFLAIAIFLIGAIIYNIVRYFNSINRKLTFFFDSVRNEDSTLHFPENVKSQPLRDLNRSLNNLNKVISAIKIRSEHKERFFQEFMKHSTTGLMAIDEKGYIEIINDSALQIFNSRILVHIERLKQTNSSFYEILLALKPNESKIVKTLINEELHVVLMKMVELKFGNKLYKIFSLSDIKPELDEKEMETWQKLIRILTHEIMNSIAPISSVSDTLLNYFRSDRIVTAREMENIAHGLDVINERSKGLIHFVDNYRKLSKIPKPVFKDIEVNSWLESVLLLFNERKEKDGINLQVKNEYQGSAFLGDRKLLTHVVINLLNNAADALTAVDEKKLFIHVTGSESRGISIKFIDNGPGISPENLDQIFIPFFTTKENGSGIGLSLSRQIMKLHKGQLTGRSAPGKETVFEMKI